MAEPPIPSCSTGGTRDVTAWFSGWGAGPDLVDGAVMCLGLGSVFSGGVTGRIPVLLTSAWLLFRGYNGYTGVARVGVFHSHAPGEPQHCAHDPCSGFPRWPEDPSSLLIISGAVLQ